MIKKNLIKIILIFFFISGCGYNPIFSNKNSNFSIYELSTTGNSKLNKIINNRLSNYQGINSQKKFSIAIETIYNKKVASRDTKGNPKTYSVNLKSIVLVTDLEGNEYKKSFLKSINYNNRDDKSNLKKYENQTSKNLAKKISEEIIIYLRSI
tara:strand:- start:2073 stop:2531 length:459 start_codon:yes stop_codon:yes gene_type:complete